jgi:tetratricopeptide (TPR) repeat protein
MAQNLKNQDNKGRTLATLAIASAPIQPYNQVLELINTIGDANTQASALTQIARDYARAGQQQQAAKALEQAFAVVKTSKNSKGKAQILAQIAVESARIAQYDRTMDDSASRFAIAVAQTIDATEKGSPKAWTLAKIGGYYAKAGQKDKARELLSQALQVANATKCSD